MANITSPSAGVRIPLAQIGSCRKIVRFCHECSSTIWQVLRIIGRSKIAQRAHLNSKKKSVVPEDFICTLKSASGATKGLEPQKVNIIAYVKLLLGRFLAWFLTMTFQKSWKKAMYSIKAALSDVPNGAYFLRFQPFIINWPINHFLSIFLEL